MSPTGKHEAGNHKPLLFFFGPGTTIAVVVAAFMVWSQLSKPQKVQIERQVVPGAGIAIRKPSPEQLLNWNMQLQLTELQKEKLKRILQDERLALAPINFDIDRQIKKFNDFATTHRSASMDDIEIYRKPLSKLSQKKRITEHSFEEQGMELLSTKQQATAQHLYQSLVSGFNSKHR